MTPCNVVAMASVKGLDAIAISDHNAIGNVKTAMECGEAFGVVVLPAVEVQTAEDIHVLALFPDYEKLEKFFSTLNFPDIKNKPEIFGDQYFYDSDNEITGEETRYLLSGAEEDIYTVCRRIKEYGGKAVPAHIDRDANGILAILGVIPPDLAFDALEFSPHASKELKQEYSFPQHNRQRRSPSRRYFRKGKFPRSYRPFRPFRFRSRIKSPKEVFLSLF